MGRCFQDVGLTELTNIVAKQCPNKMHHTKENFDECIRDNLEAVTGFVNVGNQLICWFCTAKKPTIMPMHEFMQRQLQLLSYLDSGYLHWTMELPTAQEMSEHIFLMQPKADQYMFAETNKMVPTDPLWLLVLF